MSSSTKTRQELLLWYCGVGEEYVGVTINQELEDSLWQSEDNSVH